MPESYSGEVTQENILEIQKLIWPRINDTGKEITLYTYDDNPDLIRPFVIKPGEHIIFPKQVQFLNALDKYDAILYGGAVGSGKIVYRGGTILTPFGFKKIEDFEVGDKVNNPDGSVCEIVQLHPWSEHEVWRVHFHDGTFTDVAEGHLWNVWRAGKSQKKKGEIVNAEASAKVIETRMLKEWTDQAKLRSINNKNLAYWPLIPVCEEQSFNQPSRNPSLIDPYLLGYLLGDGHLGDSISITTMDHAHFAEQFSGLEASRYSKKGDKASSYELTGKSAVAVKHALNVLGLRDTRSYNKFIPGVFKHGSIETRYAVLQGLMDTDGTVDEGGHPSYCSTSKQLADDVAYIIRSLGGVVTISCKEMSEKKETYHDAYILYIKHPNAEKFFRMKRKADRVKPGQATMFRKVVKVEILDERQWGRCITVSHPNGLYITNDFIVTHNSWILRWALIWLLLKWALPKSQGGYGLRKVDVGLFCETYTALEDRQVGALKAMPETLGTWNEKKREFRLHDRLGGGAVKCRNLDEYWKYASVQFAAIAIDELTHNPEQTYDFLRTRRRYPPIEHCPIIAASNPGNIGNSWVVSRFVDPKTRVRPHYDAKLDYYSKGYYFLQSFPSDNPTLTKQYLADLNRLPEKQRRALVLGDWTVFQGQYFSMLDPNIHYIPWFNVPENWSRFRAIDHGSAHPTVCLWGAVDQDHNLYVYREYSHGGEYATYHKRRITELSGHEKYRATVGDPSMWSNEHSSEMNKMPAEVYNDSSDGMGSLNMHRANNARIQGWQALADGFSFELEGGRYDFDEFGRPQIKFIRRPRIFIMDNCHYTWESLTNVLHDEAKVEDVKKTRSTYGPGKGDDEAEALRYLNLAASPAAVESLVTKPSGIIAPWSKNKSRQSMLTAYARF